MATVSKRVDLLTETYFQRSAVSENLDLLTEPIFQGLAVSKYPQFAHGTGFSEGLR